MCSKTVVERKRKRKQRKGAKKIENEKSALGLPDAAGGSALGRSLRGAALHAGESIGRTARLRRPVEPARTARCKARLQFKVIGQFAQTLLVFLRMSQNQSVCNGERVRRRRRKKKKKKNRNISVAPTLAPTFKKYRIHVAPFSSTIVPIVAIRAIHFVQLVAINVRHFAVSGSLPDFVVVNRNSKQEKENRGRVLKERQIKILIFFKKFNINNKTNHAEKRRKANAKRTSCCPGTRSLGGASCCSTPDR